MAKARNITPVRDRALQAYKKANGTLVVGLLEVWKRRSNQTVVVRDMHYGNAMIWSYKGGSLRKIGA